MPKKEESVISIGHLTSMFQEVVWIKVCLDSNSLMKKEQAGLLLIYSQLQVT